MYLNQQFMNKTVLSEDDDDDDDTNYSLKTTVVAS